LLELTANIILHESFNPHIKLYFKICSNNNAVSFNISVFNAQYNA